VIVKVIQMASSLSQSPLPAAMRIVHVLLFLTAAVLSSPAKNGRDAFAGLGRDLFTSQLPASVCTLYVAPNGLDKNSGRTPRSAITLLQAARQAVAGDVVCIEPGNYSLARTFAPAHSGKPNAWITYERYGAEAVNIVWAGEAGQSMFHIYGATFPAGPSYLEFRGLTLNGRNIAGDGFFCQGSHHVRYLQNTVINQGSAGIASVRCDYQTADHNIAFHNGYNGGWSSGISYNSNQWFDSYTGLHNIISNNTVAGSYDSSKYHTDGNGIIIDLSNGTYAASTANTPPTLIVNNVVYGNGGSCIEDFVVTNVWIVNNTCYDNGLDLGLGDIGNIISHNASNEKFVNNVVHSWGKRPAFAVVGAINTNLVFSHNLIQGGTSSGISHTNSADFLMADPKFLRPPPFDPAADRQYRKALNPTTLGDGLNMRSNSPGRGFGIDPISLAGNNGNLIKDLGSYVYTDIDGNPRPRGGPFTVGAYQR
jgi:hypothetical protein